MCKIDSNASSQTFAERNGVSMKIFTSRLKPTFWHENPGIWKNVFIVCMNKDIMLIGVPAGILQFLHCRSSSGATRFDNLAKILSLDLMQTDWYTCVLPVMPKFRRSPSFTTALKYGNLCNSPQDASRGRFWSSLRTFSSLLGLSRRSNQMIDNVFAAVSLPAAIKS